MKIGEKHKLVKTTPYGFAKVDGAYLAATEEVRKFVKQYLPCEVTVLEIEKNEKGYDVAKKVSVDKADTTAPTQPQNNWPTKDLTITRLACIKAAADCSALETAENIIKKAEAFEQWVLR